MAPGKDGERLPDGVTVFRLGRSSSGQLTPEAFHLSSVDKTSATPRLSVYCEGLTKVAEADGLTGRKHDVAGFLPVGKIRELRPEPDHPGVQHLDIEWETAREQGLGAEGHCGITRLNQERARDGTQLRVFRKSLYGRLARLANERLERIVRDPVAAA